MHAKINGCPHAGSRGPHGRAKKLEESQVPPFKYVVPHNNGHGFLDGFQREVMWQFPFSVKFVQPLSNNFNGMFGVYVGVHRAGISDEQPDVGREASSSL